MTIESRKISESIHEDIYQDFHPLEQSPVSDDYYDCCEVPDIIESRGIYVCKNCATVHGPALKDYISYDLTLNNISTEKKYRYPPQYYGCRTVFSVENLSAKRKALYQRLSKLNQYFHNSFEYNMTYANQILFKIAAQLEIPLSIRRHAMQIYIKVVNKRLTVGRSIKHLVTASLYIACLLNEFSRPLEEFSKISQISPKTLRKNYRLILKELNIKLPIIPASHYLSNFCIKLGLSVNFQNQAKKLLELISKNGFNENSSPRSFAAAAIYVTSKNLVKEARIRQRDLSELTKVSEVTIRKYIKLFKSNLSSVLT